MPSDIVAILDENGNTVVSYGYDAWGAPLWCTGELAETLGKVQPFRYRGYVFDWETGLYYLRSRYYSNQFCRFLNADSLYASNLFSYCHNEPVQFVDVDGTTERTDSRNPFLEKILQEIGGGGGGAVIAGGSVGWWLSELLKDLHKLLHPMHQLEQSEAASVTSSSTEITLSDKIKWDVSEEKKHHVARGSKKSGGHDWSPFNIDPNNSDDDMWEEIVKLLKTVAEKGEPFMRGDTDPKVKTYIYYFEEFKKSVIMVLHQAEDGWYTITDGYIVK